MAASARPDVSPPVRQLAAQLADANPMWRGSLSERTMKCSKPGCACAKDPKARHGPYLSLTHAVGRKTRSRFLTAEQAGPVRRQIHAGRVSKLEIAARRQALRLAARALEQRLNADTSDHAGPGTALLLWRSGPVSWPSPEDVRKRAGPSAFGAGLLSLCQMRKRLLPA